MRRRPSTRTDALRPLLRETLFATGCMLLLALVLFPDVVLLGHTTTTSAYSAGVLGDPPHAGWPEGTLLEKNPYLRDPLASAIASEPIAEYTAGLLDEPGRALWDPHRSLGTPVLATGDPQLVSPIRLPLSVFPTPVGWDVFILLRLVATGVLVHLLAWRLGWSRPAAVVAAVVAAAGGFTTLHVNSVHVDQLLALAAGLHAVLSFAASRRPLALLAVGLTGYAVVVADNLQAGLLGMLWLALFLLHALRRDGLPWPRALGTTALAGAAPFLLAAFVLVPMVELAGTPFSDGLSVHRHTADRLVGLVDLPPQALADTLVPYIGLGSGEWYDINVALGLVVVALAVLGARHRGPHRRFLVASAALLLGKAFSIPLVSSIGGLPVLSGVNFLLYGAALLQLTVAMLAGAGIERLRERPSPREPVVVGGVVAAVAVVAVVWRPPAGVDRVGLLVVHLALLAGTCAVASLAVANPSRRHGAALVGLVVLQTFVVWLPQLGAAVFDGPTEAVLGLEVIDRPVRTDPFTAPPFVTELQRRAEPGERIVAEGGMLFPNSAGVFDLEDVRGMSAFTVARFHGLVAAFVDSRDPWRFDGRSWEDLRSDAASPRLPDVLDLLGVEWVVSHVPLPEEVLAARYPEFEEVFVGPNARIYHNPDAFDRAFVVHDAVLASSSEDAFRRMADTELDLRRTVVLEADELPPLDPDAAGPGRVETLQLEAGRARFRVETSAPGVLVVSETWYPGWRATVDGSPVEVLPADGALQAVAVPAGTSEVAFVFQPSSVQLGSALTLLTLLGLLGAAAADRWRRRPSGTTPDASSSGTAAGSLDQVPA